MSVDAAIIKEHFETDLSDAALTRLINAEVEEINRRYGSDASVTEQHSLAVPMGVDHEEGQVIGRRRIWTQQKISYVTSIKEGPSLAAADLTVLVANTDYRVIYDGNVIERIDTDFQRWVEIIYAPVSDSYRRDRVVIDLVKLAIQYSGLDSESVGDWSGSTLDYQKERESILSTLNVGRRLYA